MSSSVSVFEAVLKTRSRIIRLKSSWLRLEFLNLIIHCCSFFKQFTSNYEILKVKVREVFPNIDFFHLVQL